MGEVHDRLVSTYRQKLIRNKYKICRSRLVDYKPDIYATKNSEGLLIEAEIPVTLWNDHTLHQLELMYKHIQGNRKIKGILLVPKKIIKDARHLIEMTFGDDSIRVEGI